MRAAVLICIALAGCASTSQQAKIADALALTPQHFRDTATVKDDSLDTIAQISTEPGFKDKKGLLGIVWDDNFLRAFIDKKTGATTIQAYNIVYYGGGWRFYRSANYETPNGPTSVALTVMGRDVDCTGSRYGGCHYWEHVGFSVDEALLRIVAAKYVPGEARAWRYKLRAQAGQDYNDGILGAEVVGFLGAIDAYRSRKNLTSPVARSDGAPAPSVTPGIADGASTQNAAPALTKKPPPPPTGQDAFVAGKFGRDARCGALDTPAVLAAKGPGYETYSMACTNGDTLMIRCELGNCRGLK